MNAIAVPENDTTEQKGRSKLDTMRRTVAERETEIIEMQDQTAKLRVEEEAAVNEAARARPTRRIFAVGSPVERIRRKREKLEAAIPLAQRELEALRLALDECEAEHADEDLVQACKRLRVSQDRQRACWERAAALLVDLFDIWSDLAVEVEEADADAGAVLAGDAYRLASDEAKAELDRAAGMVALVEPAPRTLAAFALRLIEASQSSENMQDDYVEQSLGQGETVDPTTGLRVRRPAKIVQVPSQSIYLDRRRVLRDVSPDLRAAPTLRPSQRVELLGGSPLMEMI